MVNIENVDSVPNTASLFASKVEVELRGDIWWKYANPVIERDSFLLHSKGSEPVLDVVGKLVAIVKQGCLKQTQEQELPLQEPRWTSFALRRQQETCFSRVAAEQACGCVGTVPFSEVEYALVRDASFFCRIPLDWTRSDVGKLQSGEIVDPSELACASGELPDDQLLDVAHWTDARGQVHVCSKIEGLFVRLTVHRIIFSGRYGTGMQTKRPFYSYIDFYVKGGHEFVIELNRYRTAMLRRWEAGHCVKMFWADRDQPSVGEYYTGTIVKVLKYDRKHPQRDSTWERLQVAWDAGEDEEESVTLVNAWEVVPASYTMPSESGDRLSLPSAVRELIADDDGDDGSRSDNSADGPRHKRRRRSRTQSGASRQQRGCPSAAPAQTDGASASHRQPSGMWCGTQLPPQGTRLNCPGTR